MAIPFPCQCTLTSDTVMLHIFADDNPQAYGVPYSSLLTQGIIFDQFNLSVQWKYSPTWLNYASNWPVWPHTQILLLQAVADEEVDIPQVGTTKTSGIGLRQIINVKRFTKLSKLLSITAYVYQFTNNCQQPRSSEQKGPLTVSKLNLKWIQDIQLSTQSSSKKLLTFSQVATVHL